MIHWQDDHLTLYGGDCRQVLAELPAESVHCVVTSPPYWGLRDYGHGEQLGLEPTPEAYVENMVAVFREVRRVLRADGTLWLNLGDSYAGSEPGRRDGARRNEAGTFAEGELRVRQAGGTDGVRQRPLPLAGLKPKDLVGIPWRVAFALQADGWYLRSDIIWSKPNPMPESVTDRPTKAHEYLFLLSKSPRYYFDADAVREAADPWNSAKGFSPGGMRAKYGVGTAGGEQWNGTGTHEDKYQSGRNLRSVWTIATEPYPGAHFATFPRKLVEPCIKAGTSERGVCPECGAPWVRETRPGDVPRNMDRPQARRAVELAEAAGLTPEHLAAIRAVGVTDAGKARVTQDGYGKNAQGVADLADEAKDVLGGYYREFLLTDPETTGWAPSCAHGRDDVGATVLDPFAGSGTTLFVAQALGRRGIGIDLNPDYLRQALVRNAQTPLGLIG